MQLVTDQPEQRPVIWEWLNKRINLPWSTDLRTMAVMRDDGTIACAVAFNAGRPAPAGCTLRLMAITASSAVCGRQRLSIRL